MSENYNQNLTNIVNSYIGKKSLCMLLLASSLLFYNMATKSGSNIPKFYTLTIAISLILYSVIIGMLALYEFNSEMNKVILKAQKLNDINLAYSKFIKNTYQILGCFYFILLIYISYILIRFDNK